MMRVFRPFPHWWAILTRLSLRSLILPALCLALGVTWAQAQTAQDRSVDIPIDSDGHPLRLADFGPTSSASGIVIIKIKSLPARGSLQRYSSGIPVLLVVGDFIHGNTSFFTFSTLGGADADDRLEYRPPANAGSPATGYDSFVFHYSVDSGFTATTATMTINLVGASMPTTATGAPTIAATDTHRIRASITGVTDLNGIDVGTLSWQWQQADAPVSGVPDTGDYIDIKDATSSSLFAPTAAQLSRYVRACVSFKDQSPTPASEGPLCSIGILVTELPSEIRLRLRLFLEGPLR